MRVIALVALYQKYCCMLAALRSTSCCVFSGGLMSHAPNEQRKDAAWHMVQHNKHLPCNAAKVLLL